MALKTIDIGDGERRPIQFKMSYAKTLREKYESLDKMLAEVDLDDLVPELAYNGLVTKGDFTVDSIRDMINSDERLTLMSDLWQALTGLRIDFLAMRQNAIDSVLTKNAPTQTALTETIQ